MPLLVPSLLSVWVWTAMHAVRELSAAIMLSSPGTTVISVVIWDLWEEGMVSETLRHLARHPRSPQSLFIPTSNLRVLVFILNQSPSLFYININPVGSVLSR